MTFSNDDTGRVWTQPILDFFTHPGGILRWYNDDQILFIGAAPSSEFGGDIQNLCDAAQQAGATNPGGVQNYRNVWWHYYDTDI